LDYAVLDSRPRHSLQAAQDQGHSGRPPGSPRKPGGSGPLVGLADLTTPCSRRRAATRPPAPAHQEDHMFEHKCRLNGWLRAALLAALLFLVSAPSARAGVNGPWGGGGGLPFDEPAPPGSHLAEIWVREGRLIDAILLVWRRPDGSLAYSPWYGGT